jgi:hypothetical protein
MSESQSNLNYEFYWLFQTQSEPAALPDFEEVKVEAGNLYNIKMTDKDKRLFRWNAEASPPLDEWANCLQRGWQQLGDYYGRYGSKPDFYESAFMGVALLIMDETVDTHQIKIGTTTGATVIFQSAPHKTAAEKILLQIEENQDHVLPKPVTFEEWVELDQTQVAWQIQLSSLHPPRLTPIQVGEAPQNPVFAVYGLAHGRLEDDCATQLQNFLCSGTTAVFARLLPRLLMQKWQYTRINEDAHHFRTRLDNKNHSFQQHPDTQLECLWTNTLEHHLREMAGLNATAMFMLSRLQSSIKTLEITRNNIERQLQRSQAVWQELDPTVLTHKYEWLLRWQFASHTPLLDKVNLDILHLENHRTYLQSSLNYLAGIRHRWELPLEERRLEISERLGQLGHFLIFLVALGEVIVLSHPGEPGKEAPLQTGSGFLSWLEHVAWLQQLGSWLHSSAVYVLLILILLGLPVFYMVIIVGSKKLRCWWRHLTK